MTDEDARDDDVRAAFDDLKPAIQNLDTVAARREPEGHRRMGLILLGVLAFLVGVLGITYAVTTSEDPEQVTADVVDGAVDGNDAVAGSNELAGTTWVLREGAPIVNGWPVTLTFEADTFGGTAACNGYGGSYSIDGPALELGEISQTTAGCEEWVLKSEEVFLTGLGAVDSFLLDGDRLVLSGTEPDLVLIPDEATSVDALIDETWLLIEYSDGGRSVGAAGTGAHLRLHADGTLEGGTGCRSLNGTWVENGAEILFPNFGAEGECSEELSRQDNQVTTVLGDGFRAELLGDKLFLTSAGNEVLFYGRSFDEEDRAEPNVDDEVGFSFDENLTWSVILVEADDVLNVRSGPGIDNDIVG
ncbi:MAG: META domain-containing protein [Actinomycetia bacterium]|nr:META domain-containing protein [Actinomycetes bacterium]